MKNSKILFFPFLLTFGLIFFGNISSSYAQQSARDGWVNLDNHSGYPFEKFRLVDFNGDGITDIICLHNNAWWYSKSSHELWTTFNNSSPLLQIDPNEIKLGDFDGDGTLDFFFEWKGNWCYASGATMMGRKRANPIILQKAVLKVSEVGLGDFDRDGITDIFLPIHWPESKTWQYSPKGTGQ